MNPKMTVVDTSVFLNQTVQNVHRIIKEKNLSFEKSANRVFFNYNTAKQIFNFKFGGPKVIAVQIVKGGPGKTSITKNLGIRAALYGARVLLIDLDQQGNLTNDFLQTADDKPIMIDIVKGEGGLTIRDAIVNVLPGLDLIPSRLENSAIDQLLMLERHPLDKVYADIIAPLRNEYDYILIDCPPAISSSVAAASLASDLILCPVAPEKYCLDGLKMTHQELMNIERKYRKSIPYRIVMNKFDNRLSLSSDVLKALHNSKTYGDKLYKTCVRDTQEIKASTARRESVFDCLRITGAQEDIDALTREVFGLNDQRPAAKIEIPLGKLMDEVEIPVGKTTQDSAVAVQPSL
jgi:chromosome partitioning protein